MLKNIDPSKTVAWTKLEKHFEEMKSIYMQDLFANDEQRTERFHIEWESFLVDYSKHKITDKTLELLWELAKEVNLKEAIDLMFSGATINHTEERAVLHTALRCFSEENITETNAPGLKEEIVNTRKRTFDFINDVLDSEYLSSTGKKFTDVINIGIGGSDLGPRMVVEALGNYQEGLKVHYLSNIDEDYVNLVLSKLNAETTLVLIVSKTFTTQETILNAKKVRAWLKMQLTEDSYSKHLVGITAHVEEAIAFGVKETTIFPMWDCIGGRFSLWSSVGLSIGLSIGAKNYERLLQGANQMDIHFKNTPFESNIPVVLAMLSVWYNNFFGYESEVVIPYSQFLERFPAHLQQMIMESNGKNTDRDGNAVTYQTGNLIWGEVGVNAQHAFFQLFHQGTKIAPIDFIGFVKTHATNSTQHDALMSNFFGQSEALLMGLNQEVEDTSDLISFRRFEGNKPSTTMLIDHLTPETLGALVALYEHKTFVQGIVWNIYSFDQFGVEYGKVLAKNIQSEISSNNVMKHDGSTSFLLNCYLNKRKA
ncbi:MAG: glucose-6-phosphate isomerase [Flavobacteriaceae bacterium]|jgi:glucose-6-phosphate isomerase|nr:glucose-6-phosphate isomerase [Flavobacteriaceae bacterium]